MFSNVGLMSIAGIIGGAFFSWWAFIRPLFTCSYRLESEASKRLLTVVLSKARWKYVISNHFVVEPKMPDIFEAFILLQGCFLFFSRSERLLTAGWKNKESVSQVTCFRWQKSRVEEMLRYTWDGVTVPVYALMPGSSGSDKLGELACDKDAKVYLPAKYYSDIEAEVEDVIAGRRNKTSMLLYGPPGSGKTQFVKYLSRKHGLPIYVVYFSPDYTNHDISMMFSELPRNCIVLMEDFDTYFNGRECAMKNDQVRFTFDSIINALDGVHNDYRGVIFAMTANDIDRIDDSMKKRPSRFKFVRKFDSPSYKTRLSILGDKTLAKQTEGMSLDEVFAKQPLS